jgi:glycine oxidase
VVSPTLSRKSLRVVVAGGGAFGLASALCLARRGAEVTLCDPARPGDNASGVAAGMLAPAFEALLDPPSQDHFAVLSAARALWPAFAADLGLPLERDGALWAGGDPAAVEARLTRMEARARRLPAAEAMAAVPGLRIDGEAVFTPEDWRLDVSAALLALRTAAISANVRLVDRAVVGFETGTVRLADGVSIDADRLVVAVGAARTDLAPELARLAPVKGHILRMAGGPRQGPVVRAEKVYVRPHPSGAIVGASMELGRSDADIDPTIVADLVARATALFPGLAGVQHHVATGIRATTDDGLPLVGSSVRPDVLLAVGARRNGWLLAPAVGQAVAAAAFGDEPGEGDLFRPL